MLFRVFADFGNDGQAAGAVISYLHEGSPSTKYGGDVI